MRATRWRTNLLVVVAAALLPLVAHSLEPRGYRNNNPGNIVQSPTPWQGKVECTNGEKIHECFETEWYGLRATAIVLRTYVHSHGLTTLPEIMNRFSEFPGASRGVSLISGIGEEEEVNPRDLEQMARLLFAIVVQENGHSRYSLEYLREVIYDSYGAVYFAGLDPPVRSAKGVGDEAASAERRAPQHDAGAWRRAGRAAGDTRQHEHALSMDPQGYSPVRGVVCHSTTEDGSSAAPRTARHRGVDGVEGGVLAIYQWPRRFNVARCKGLSDYPIGYTLS